MISLKRYLDSGHDTALKELIAALVAAYQSTLNTTGAAAATACPQVDPELRRRLTGLGQQIDNVEDPALVTGTNELVAQELKQWGESADQHLQQKTNDVKELLLLLASTASAIAASHDSHSRRFDGFTTKLERMATLDDVSELRRSLIRSAAELRHCVNEMSEANRATVAGLQAELVTYQSRLEAVEETAARDSLTGLFNRGKIEAVIDSKMKLGRIFAIALIDLDGFKDVNDRLGHAAGDDLLKQFSAELKSNSRPTDYIGRWGGDEFIIVLDCRRAEAQAHVERIEKWVVGDYTIDGPASREKVRLDASIGLSEWRPGVSMKELLEQADLSMYSQKRGRR